MRPVVALAGLAAVFAAVPAGAQPQARPKLAIVITVKGLTSDLFNRYRTQFSGGLARFARGTSFLNASADADAGSATASRAKTIASAGITAAVSGDDPSATSAFDHAWGWDGAAFASGRSSARLQIIPVANAAIARLIGAPEPPLVPPPACAGAMPSSRFGRAAGDRAAFAASPALDGAVLAVAAGMIGELRMGTDSAPDVLTVQLPAPGLAGERYAANSEASCLQLLSLDRDLAGFFSQLDRGGLDYVVTLTGAAGGKAAVPMLFWGAGIGQSDRPETASAADIAPTVVALLGLGGSKEAPGRCLGAVAGAACTD